MNRPNILYLHSHDTGRYIQPYGHAVPTPNLQRLAEEGTLFRQAFCVTPTCSASRAGLLTGQASHTSGMLGLAHRGWSLYDYQQHIVHTVRQAGYRSTLAGHQHVSGQPQGAARIGYDQVLPTESFKAEHVSQVAAEFLGGEPSQPFFLTVGFSETHREFPEPGPDEDPRYCIPPAPLPDTPETRRDMAAFKACARLYDHGVGVVLDALEANGLAESTLVISTCDHGIAFPGMKCNLTDHGLGVMLLMRGPGGFNGGQVVDGMVSHVDIFPTICEWLEIDPPPWLQGRSFMPLVRGEAYEVNDAIFAGVTYHASYEPQRCVRTKRWKYIRRFEDRDTPVMPNCDDSPSKDVWLTHGWRERPVASEQLYDLVFDPNEACNLAADPAHATTLDEMRARMQKWMNETADPLLNGPVPAPAGAKVNPIDDLSPREKV
jgi:N-sulfoglucosamine sulfohydrolase